MNFVLQIYYTRNSCDAQVARKLRPCASASKAVGTTPSSCDVSSSRVCEKWQALHTPTHANECWDLKHITSAVVRAMQTTHTHTHTHINPHTQAHTDIHIHTHAHSQLHTHTNTHFNTEVREVCHHWNRGLVCKWHQYISEELVCNVVCVVNTAGCTTQVSKSLWICALMHQKPDFRSRRSAM